jgi:hypothetical protein
MAKKQISSVELNWIILEQLRTGGRIPIGFTVAVVADTKDGWRAVVEKRSRKYVSPEFARRLDALQKRLRLAYALAQD